MRTKKICQWKPDFCKARGCCQIGLKKCEKRVTAPKRAPYEHRKVRIKDLR